MKDSLELPVTCPMYRERACGFQLMGEEGGEKAASRGPTVESGELQRFPGGCAWRQMNQPLTLL